MKLAVTPPATAVEPGPRPRPRPPIIHNTEDDGVPRRKRKCQDPPASLCPAWVRLSLESHEQTKRPTSASARRRKTEEIEKLRGMKREIGKTQTDKITRQTDGRSHRRKSRPNGSARKRMGDDFGTCSAAQCRQARNPMARRPTAKTLIKTNGVMKIQIMSDVDVILKLESRVELNEFKRS